MFMCCVRGDSNIHVSLGSEPDSLVHSTGTKSGRVPSANHFSFVILLLFGKLFARDQGSSLVINPLLLVVHLTEQPFGYKL